MMPRGLFAGWACLFIAAIPAIGATNAPLPFVSPMFGDHMVLQRKKPNTIWGWSKPGDTVRVSLAGHSAKTVADSYLGTNRISMVYSLLQHQEDSYLT